MTRLIFTCMVLLVSLFAIQYTIWTGGGPKDTFSSPDVNTPLMEVNSTVIQQEYIFQYDSMGRLIIVRKERIVEL